MNSQTSSGELSDPFQHEENSLDDADSSFGHDQRQEDASNQDETDQQGQSGYQLYNVYRVCESLDKAKSLIASGEVDGTRWLAKTISASKQGDKYWYGCRVKGCPRNMQVVLNIDSLTDVTILLGNKPHLHDEAGGEGRILKNPGVHPDSKQKIIELESLGVKPKAILYRLHELNLPEPTMQQLNNFLKNHRAKQAGIEGPSSSLYLNDLKD